MKIFVTGATGLVGNNCLRILGKDHELHVLVRKGYDSRPFETLNVSFHQGDLIAPNVIPNVIPEVDVIIHAAGDIHIGKQPRPSQRIVNTLATAKIAEVARDRGIKLIFVSSVDALPPGSVDRIVDEETEGDAKSSIEYVQTKRSAEDDLQTQIEAGLDAVIVNPGFMLGPWDWKPSSGKMLLEVATKFTPFAPSGGFSISDVRDVASAICRIAQFRTEHRRYILAGNNVTYFEAWKVFAEISGGSAPIGVAGPVTLGLAGRWGDFVAKCTGREGDINSGSIGMAKQFHYYDSSRAVEELGYKIRPIREIVQESWSWFKSHGFVP